MTVNKDDPANNGADGETKPEVTFPTKKAFLDEVDRKSKSRAEQAAAEARTSLLSKLGIESEDEIESVKERLAKTATVLSAAEQQKKATDKLAQEKHDLEQRIAALEGFKRDRTIDDQIRAAGAEASDPDLLVSYTRGRVTINDEGKVVGVDGEPLDKVIAGVFKAKPLLKRPETTPGAGTRPIPTVNGGGGEGGSDGKPKAYDPKAFAATMQKVADGAG